MVYTAAINLNFPGKFKISNCQTSSITQKLLT
jgi:hypothetical protein